MLLFKYLLFILLVQVANAQSRMAPDDIFIIHSEVSPELEEKIVQSLSFIKRINFSETTEAHKEFFGDSADGNGYLRLLSKTIAVAGYSEAKSEHLLAYTNNQAPIMILTANVLQLDLYDELDLITMVSVLIHEAWHIFERQSGLPKGHIACPQKSVHGEPIVGHITNKSLEGKFACDSSPKGAYVIQSEMLYNIGKFCTTCSELERESALYLSKEMSKRVIAPALVWH